MGYVGLVTAACFAARGFDVVCRDIDQDKVAALQARRGADPRAGTRRAGDASTRAAALHDRPGRAVRARARWPSSASTRRRRSPATPTSRACRAVIDAIPADRRGRGAGDEVDRAGRHGAPAAGRARRAGPGGGRLRVEPRVPARGHGDLGLHAPRPRRRSAPSARPTATAWPRCTPASTAPVVRTDVPSGGDGQAGLERVPRDEDQLHQRDRERLRGGRRGRRRGRARHGPRPAHRRELPAAGGRLRRFSCFPKDVSALKQLAGNTGYAFQLLAAVIEVNELQKRRVVDPPAARPRQRCAASGSRCWAWPSSPTPTTCARRRASCWPGAWSPRARASSRTTRSPPSAPGRCSTADASRSRAPCCEALRDADAAVIVTEWDEFRGVLEPAAREQMRGPLLIDGRNLLDPAAAAEAGYEYDSVGRPAAAGRARVQHVIAVVLVGGEGTRLRPLTLDRPKPMLPDRRAAVPAALPRPPRRRRRRARDPLLRLPAGRHPRVLGDGLPGGPPVEYAIEPEPLGTAGAIRFAAEGRVGGEPFLALNGDVLADADLGAVVARPPRAGARATIVLTPKDDPRRYGVVLTDGDGAVTAFLEKPEPVARARPAAVLDQRRRLRARPRRARPDPGRPAPCRSSARCSRRSSATACARCATTATSTTSARRSATCGANLDVARRHRAHGRRAATRTLVDVADDAHVDPAARLVPPVLVCAGAHDRRRGRGRAARRRRRRRPRRARRAASRARVVHEHADVGVDGRVSDAVVGTRARVAGRAPSSTGASSRRTTTSTAEPADG